MLCWIIPGWGCVNELTGHFLREHEWQTVSVRSSHYDAACVHTSADSNDITVHRDCDVSMLYLCTVCDQQFTRNDHRKRHTGEKLYSCTQCEKRYLSRGALSSHMNIHRGKYKCTECDQYCRSSQRLAIHRRIHSGEKPFECTVCSKRFSDAGNLVRHSRIHSGEKPYKCCVCDKAFGHSDNLERHMRVHTGDKPYKRPLCNKCFSQYSNLQLHKRRVHSDRIPYHCPYCRKLFKINTELKGHVCIHTDAKPFWCRHCSDCFRRLTQLQVSYLLKSHNEGTWFTYNICQQQFITRGELKLHSLRCHEGVKPYVCSECPSVSVQQLNWDLIVWFTCRFQIVLLWSLW